MGGTGQRRLPQPRRAGRGMLALALALATLLATSGNARNLVVRMAETNDPSLEVMLRKDPRQGNHNFLRYSIGMIVDPCQGHPANCCENRFGEPEYLREPRASSSGWVWALARDTRLPYKCQKPCVGVWRLVNESSELHEFAFDALDADEEMVWALNLQQFKLFRRGLDGTTPWIYTSGDFSSISASGAGSIYGVMRLEPRRLLACAKPCTGQWLPPTEPEGHPNAGTAWAPPRLKGGADGEFVQVDADRTHVWMLSRGGRLFSRRVAILATEQLEWRELLLDPGAAPTQAEQEENSTAAPLSEDFLGDWEEVGGELRFSRIATSGATRTIWAAETDGRTVHACTSPCIASRWNLIGTVGSGDSDIESLDVDRSHVWVTTANGKVFQYPVDLEVQHTWRRVPAINDKSVASLRAWETVPDGGFRFVSPSANQEAAETFQAYTVEEFANQCAWYTDMDTCNGRVEDRCSWNMRQGLCERRIPRSNSRLLDETVQFFDPECILAPAITSEGELLMEAGFALTNVKEGAELEVKNDPACVDAGVRKYLPATRPACWDNNATVDASKPCLDQDGVEHPFCVTVGVAQTAFLVRCGGAFADDPDCGTFLELHAPGNETIISEVRVSAGDDDFVQGYRTLAFPLSLHSFRSAGTVRVVCSGPFEIWWVQRARRFHILEAIKRFEVVLPLCDWNPSIGAYERFSAIETDANGSL